MVIFDQFGGQFKPILMILMQLFFLHVQLAVTSVHEYCHSIAGSTVAQVGWCPAVHGVEVLPAANVRQQILGRASLSDSTVLIHVATYWNATEIILSVDG